MSKQEFLDRVRIGRAALTTAFGGLTEAEMTGEVVAGEWTIKDILAHLAAWDGEALRAAQRVARGEPDNFPTDQDIDEWNTRRVEERRRLPLVDVIEEFTATRDALMASLEQCPESGAAAEPGWWEPDGPLWWLTWHDGEHAGAIRAYRERASTT